MAGKNASIGMQTVDGKSSRTVRHLDAAGNDVRIERYALVGGEWHELDWETHAYNATHKVVLSVYSDGTTDAADWICTGPVYETGRDGVTVSNEYDAAKLLAVSTRYGAFGAVRTEYSHDNEGRVVCEVKSAANCETQTVSRVYDSRGRIVSETDAHGVTTLRQYGADDRTNTVIHADGGTVVTVLNPDGSVSSITGTATLPEFRVYSVSNGLAVTEVRYGRTDSPRYETTYRNGFGETVRIERSGFGGATLVTESECDSLGRLVATIETGKPTVNYAYDDWGERTSTVQSADGVVRTVEQTQAYALIDGEVWFGGLQTVFTSDASIAPLVAESYAKVSGLALTNIAERFSVDVRGNTNRVWSVLDPLSAKRTAWTRQSGIGNLAVEESVDGETTLSVDTWCVTNRTGYDAFRRRASVTDGRGNTTTYAYDGCGRLAAVTDAATNTTRYAYDAMGRVTEMTNALGNVTFAEYDARGNKIYEGGATYPVRYGYDVYGNHTSMTTYRDEASGVGDTTTWLYDDASGCITNKVYADGKGPTYSYDANGRLVRRAWARGILTDYRYDGWDNLIATEYSDGTTSISNAYDALGRKTSVADAAGTTEYAYDECGSLTNETWNGLGGRNLTRHYDDCGRDAGYSIDGIRTTALGYDAATGALDGMRTVEGDFSWQYLAGSHLKSKVTYPNGVTVDYTYETNRDLLTSVSNHLGDAIFSSYAYANDALGRRIAKNDEQYGYNSRDELISAAGAENCSYQYDDIGNRTASFELGTNTAYVANCLNQYVITGVTSETAFVPEYDDDGNQTLIKTSTGVWSVSYNGENRPVGWSNDATVVTMDFDAMGRRTFYREFVNGEQTTFSRFFYDGYLMIEQLHLNAPYDVYKKFVWDPSESEVTKPLCFCQNAQHESYLIHDGNKNVSDVVGASTAAAQLAHYDYAPFGARRLMTGIHASANPYRFSSEFSDDTLGLVYYTYRHYEPSTGRWFGRDFIEELGSANLYLYTFNRPQNSNDLYGLVDIPEKCPVDIDQRKQYDHYFIIKNGQSYIIYEYRTDRQVSTPISVDGCSIPSYLKWLPAGRLFNSLFDSPCRSHDRCYGTCKSNKEDCDKRFYGEMLDVCSSYSKDVGDRVYCRRMARVFYVAVSWGGGSFYDRAQDTYCEHSECSQCRKGE